MINIHRAEDRGEMNIGWLYARYSFSFSRYYDPERLGFNSLKVWNHDIVAPGKGFDPHSHKDFEIITIPLRGAVAHKDSIDHIEPPSESNAVSYGQVQTMSAGSGVTHSEYNASEDQELELFQLWLETDTIGRAPQYDTSAYDTNAHGMQILASKERGGGYIHSDSILKYVNAHDEPMSIAIDHTKSYFLMLTKGTASYKDALIKPFDSFEVEQENGNVILKKGSRGYLLTIPNK